MACSGTGLFCPTRLTDTFLIAAQEVITPVVLMWRKQDGEQVPRRMEARTGSVNSATVLVRRPSERRLTASHYAGCVPLINLILRVSRISNTGTRISSQSSSGENLQRLSRGSASTPCHFTLRATFHGLTSNVSTHLAIRKRSGRAVSSYYNYMWGSGFQPLFTSSTRHYRTIDAPTEPDYPKKKLKS